MSTSPSVRTVALGVSCVVVLGVGAVVAASHHGAAAAPPTHVGALRVVAAGGVEAAEPAHDAPWAGADPVSALAPGQMRTVEVTVTNPGTTAYRVLQLTATPRDAGAGCPADRALVVSSYRSDRPGAEDYVVQRGSSIRIPVTVMRVALPGEDSCRDATFPLALTGVVSPGQPAAKAG